MTRHEFGSQQAELKLNAPPKHLSWSQVSNLSGLYRLSCPRQWAYYKLFGLTSPANANMICGALLDDAIQVFWMTRRRGETSVAATAAALSFLEADAPRREWPDPDRAGDYTAAVLGGMAAFADAHVAAPVPATCQDKHEFTVRGNDGALVKVIGFSDAIEADGTITDYKWTGKARWDREGNWSQDYIAGKKDQLAIYYMARVAQAKRNVRMNPTLVVPRGRLTVVYGGLRVKTAQVRSIDIDLGEVDVARLVGAIKEADAVARGDRHPARPGDACGFCAFTDRCRDDLARTCGRTEELAA